MTTHAAAILAAGKGTRMRSQTPKVLHRICGMEMVSLVINTAKATNLSPVAVVVPQDSRLIRETLGSKVIYAEQSEPLGSGHALLQARTALRDADNIVVVYGDMPLIQPETIGEMVMLHDEKEACITLLTSTLVNPDDFGRVLRSSSGSITGIVEMSEADEPTLAITEVNCGVYCFRAAWLWENLASLPPSPRGEIFLTDLIARAVQQGMLVESVLSHDANEIIGINNRVQLAEAEAVLRQRIRARWMLNGVTMPDPASVYIGASAELGEDTTVLPNTHIIGRSHIGANCEIGPNSIVEDSTIGNSCKIIASFVEGSTLSEGVDVGPFSHIRPGTHLESDVHIGNFAEVKNSHLGPGTKSGHFSYIGDAQLGANVNIGAGTVTCNFDGDDKNQTTIGDDAFIGSDTMLVAPVDIGARASTGAGSVVTRDVPPDMVAIGMPARTLPKKKKAEKD